MLRHPPTPPVLSLRPTVRGALRASPVALAARKNALLANAALRQEFVAAGLNVRQVLQVGQRMQALTGPISLAQVLPLLPPKLAAKLVQGQGEALLHMLLAWGEALREQAEAAKKAQLRRDIQSQETKGHEQARQARALGVQRQLRAAQARAAQAQGVQLAASSDVPPAASSASARWELGASSLVSGLNRPMMEALSAPLAMGVALRGATLRLSSLA